MAKYKEIENTFKNTCIAMGGEYSTEYGMLESDVGGDHFSEWEAHKQWCSFRNFKTRDNETLPRITIFRAPNVIEFQQEFMRANDTYRFPGFDEFFKEKLEPKLKRMCYKSTIPSFSEDELGLSSVCIETDPTRKTLNIFMPKWGDIDVKTLEHKKGLAKLSEKYYEDPLKDYI